MVFFIIALFLLIFFGVAAKLVGNRKGPGPDTIRLLGPSCAAAIGLGLSIRCFIDDKIITMFIHGPSSMGLIQLTLDPLSCFFLSLMSVLFMVASFFGIHYLDHDHHRNNIGTVWLCTNVLMASMMLVIASQNTVLFLISWELMSLSSFMLVLFHHEKEHIQKAGWLYLSVTHVGTACLIIFFILLSQNALTLNFNEFIHQVNGPTASLCFILALIGFGTKAGIMPLHSWLPEAHPAAPGHISALMSGIMIKMGIYGILRTLSFFSVIPLWWCYLVLALGIISGIMGIIMALGQHEIKKVLAYSSVENVGVILIGISLGMLGIYYQNPSLILFGMAGALLHILNHAFFKGLLFFSASIVVQNTGTQQINVLGGLSKNMPVTSILFLLGALSACAIPPLNGFMSEFLIFMASFREVGHFQVTGVLFPFVLAIMALSLIGGLAVYCFLKVYTVVFLGSPRHDPPLIPRETQSSMLYPLIVLAVLMIFVGLCPRIIAEYLLPIISRMTVLDIPSDITEDFLLLMTQASGAMIGLMLIIAVGVGIRKLTTRHKKVEKTVTWDCGYIRPTPRIQYTASSFSLFIRNFFSPIVHTKKKALRLILIFSRQDDHSKRNQKIRSMSFFSRLSFGCFINSPFDCCTSKAEILIFISFISSSR